MDGTIHTTAPPELGVGRSDHDIAGKVGDVALIKIDRSTAKVTDAEH